MHFLNHYVYLLYIINWNMFFFFFHYYVQCQECINLQMILLCNLQSSIGAVMSMNSKWQGDNCDLCGIQTSGLSISLPNPASKTLASTLMEYDNWLRLTEDWKVKGYCTPDQFCDCSCSFLKICNTLVTSKIYFLYVIF